LEIHTYLGVFSLHWFPRSFLVCSVSKWASHAPYGMSAAYDEARAQIIYFGGYAASGSFAETWTYDGTNFVKRAPITSPPVQQFHNMAYDSLRQQIVLVLGNDLTSRTWLWNGINWAARTPSISPTARDRPVIAYDKANDQVVLFGGIVYPSTFLNDTWLWTAQIGTTQIPWTIRRVFGICQGWPLMKRGTSWFFWVQGLRMDKVKLGFGRDELGATIASACSQRTSCPRDGLRSY